MWHPTKWPLWRRGWMVKGRRLPLPVVLITTMLALTFGGFALISNRSVTNYTNPDGPKYEGDYAPEQPPFDGMLKAVTWNIAFGEDIDQAIATLRDAEELQGADVLMLQEMDEVGTEQIAQALGYNYVYYPASIHSHHGKNFGNAVLSRWPIVDSAKIILPHNNPSNGQIRIAAKATIDVDGQLIPVYSVHTETFWLGPEQRKDQIEILAQEAALSLAEESDYVVIGGDFNTLTQDSTAALTSILEKVGLEWMSRDAGETVDKAGVGAGLDHIFASNMALLSSAVFTETRASDHYPVWAVLNPNSLSQDAPPG